MSTERAAPIPSREPPSPTLTIRVGVTGARHLGASPGTVQAALGQQARELLEAVRDEVAAVGQDAGGRAVYGADPRPRLRLLSPLAEGADRLVAEAATGMGYELDVALPFAPAEYAKDFADAESRTTFERLLRWDVEGGAARPPFALDGGRGDDEAASYEAVGRLVVRNSDLLVAIWDGRPAKGRGGTGDIVRFAIRLGLPVWWIDAAGSGPPHLLMSLADLRAPERAPQGAEARRKLGQLVRGMLLPIRHRRHPHSLVGRLLQRSLRQDEDPLRAYLKGQPLVASPLWRAYGWLYRLLGGPRISPARTDAPVPDEAAAYWDAAYRPADRASTECADRYRSSYVWVFLLALLAVVSAVVSLAYPPWKLGATVAEIVLLGLILALVGANERYNWHGRWIACRLLAELCRKQAALATLGWSLPPSDLRRSLRAERDEEAARGDSQPRSAEAWVGWYFDTMLRAAPLPAGELTRPRLAAARDFVRTALVEEQRAYHEDRRSRSRRMGLRLVRLGEFAFLGTLILVLGKLALLLLVGQPETGGHDVAGSETAILHALLVGFGAIAAVLPASSAAFFGIRAYAEVELLESQSARMARVMAAACRRIDALDLARPLASQDLGAEVFEVSSAMLQEVGGWADLFRVKAVETG